MKTVFKLLRKIHVLDKIASKLVFDPPKKSSYRLNRKKEVVVDKHGNLMNEASSINYKVEYSITESGIFVLVLYPSACEKLSACSRVILYSHGTSVDIGMSINPAVKMAKVIDDRTTGLVLWDFPGYGLSKGKPSEKGINEGILEVYKMISEQFGVNGNTIIAMGFSLGSVPTVYLGTKFLTCPLQAVILISPLASAYLTLKGGKSKAKDPVGVFSNLETLNNGICPWPIFIAHGSADNVVPLQDCSLLVKSLTRFPTQQQLETCIDLQGSDSGDITGSFMDVQSTIPDSEEHWKSRVAYCPVDGAGHNNILKDSSFIGSTYQFINAL